MTDPSDLVLLLPGWGTTPERMQPLVRALEDAGCVARVWSYTPEGVFEELTAHVASVVRSMRDLHEPGDRLHLVGHSLGGVAAAATALREMPGEITSVTTINTPWRGTWVSSSGTGPLTRALRRGSPELAALREELAADLRREEGPRWLLLSALGDLATPATTALAGPPSSSRLDRRVVAAAGHSSSLGSQRVIDCVLTHVMPPTSDADDTPWPDDTPTTTAS